LAEAFKRTTNASDADSSIRSRLYRALIVPLLALVVVDAFIGYEMAHRFAAQAYDEALQLIAEDSLEQLQSLDRSTLLTDQRSLNLFTVQGRQGVLRAIFDDHNHLILGARIPSAEHAALMTMVVDQAGRRWRIYNVSLEGQPIRVMQITIGTASPLTLRVAEDRTRSVELEHLIHSLVLTPQLILIAALLWIIQQAVNHGLSPMRRLGALIVSLKGEARLHNLSRQIPAEAKPLVEAIDQLLDRLSAAKDLQDRFIADAAHQLKTPLAAIITYSELLERSQLNQEQRASLANLQAGSERLSRMLKHLSELVQDAALEWAPQAITKGQDFGLGVIAADQRVLADATRLREMLDNLIDNAIRYSPKGSQISLSLLAAPECCIQVEDSAPEIQASERMRIFERFYRIPGTRQQGSGLGLAIVRDIAALHGAKVFVKPRAHAQGNCFEVVFPAQRKQKDASLF
jgi:two-component system sensor histidine kinase TctE